MQIRKISIKYPITLAIFGTDQKLKYFNMESPEKKSVVMCA